jgi:predicted ATPase
MDAKALAAPAQLRPTAVLAANGQDLAAVLDRMRDQAPERFDAINAELARWIPEFDRILFETPSDGSRAIMLRLRDCQVPIAAQSLSAGTLVALGLLTLAYLPDPPSVVLLEEPDRGLHPRLLREVRDALYRLAYPLQHGETREPVQVIATTHSPILLDLFRDHPEEVVIANKTGTEATFQRLIDLPNYEEILADSSLGDAWYSGVLGGVPTEP